MTETRTKILDLAELAIRRGGFDAASHRDLAGQIGIKSASVHYHYPTKSDLGVAVVERYKEKVLGALGEPNQKQVSVSDQLGRLVGVYQDAYETAPCLCAVLGAVSPGLPSAVRDSVNSYFEDLEGWIINALDGEKDAQTKARVIISALQGAMVLGAATNEKDPMADIGPFISQLASAG